MIDRCARDETIDAFEAYLDGRITAFVFDERIQGVVTDDITVREVVQLAWFHDDDVKDHKVNLSKPSPSLGQMRRNEKHRSRPVESPPRWLSVYRYSQT